MPQFSESQVICGLQALWDSTVDGKGSFDASTQIVEQLKSIGLWDEIDLDDLVFEVEHFFDFTCSVETWQEFFGIDAALSWGEWEKTIAPRLTFGALAQFIVDRTEAIAFSPVTILGKTCRPAGVFRGIERLVARCCSDTASFGPSSRINAVLRGEHLDKFWTRLRWMTQNSIPELPSLWCEAPANGFVVGLFSVVLGIFGALMLGSFLPLLIAGSFGIAVYRTACLYKQATNPLPGEIQNFRDLATLVAASDCDAVCGQG